MNEYVKYKGNKTLIYLDSIRNGYRIFPPSVQISLTDWCSNKCYMCDHWLRKNKVQFDLSELFQFLHIAIENGLETVCYSGGNPLMYKHINNVMAWHLNRGVKYGFITECIFSEKVDLDLLSKAEWIRCSIDSVDKKIYEVIRGVDGIDEVKKNIGRLKSVGANIEFGITLSKENMYKIRDVAEYGIDVGISQFRLWAVRYNVMEHNAIQINNKLELRSLELYLLGVKSLLDKNKISNNIDETIDILYNGEATNKFKTCKASLYQLFIDPSGKIFPCCTMAGDSNKDFQGTAICDLEYIFKQGMKTYYTQVLRPWSEKQVDDWCHKHCIKRLSTINITVENNLNKKCFF